MTASWQHTGVNVLSFFLWVLRQFSPPCIHSKRFRSQAIFVGREGPGASLCSTQPGGLTQQTSVHWAGSRRAGSATVAPVSDAVPAHTDHANRGRCAWAWTAGRRDWIWSALLASRVLPSDCCRLVRHQFWWEFEDSHFKVKTSNLLWLRVCFPRRIPVELQEVRGGELPGVCHLCVEQPRLCNARRGLLGADCVLSATTGGQVSREVPGSPSVRF